MPTRLYFHASGAIAAPNAPAFDAAWEQTGQATRLPMDVKPMQGVQTALADSGTCTIPITTTQQILCYQFTSNQIFSSMALPGSCTFSVVIRVLESANSANAFLAYSLRAFSADGLTSLGTLASSMTNAGTEFALSAATRIFAAIAITPLMINSPWRLVLELGAHAQAPTAAQSYTMRVGTTATTDFALTSALTTDLNPWMELSDELRMGEMFGNYQAVRVGDGMSMGEKIR